MRRHGRTPRERGFTLILVVMLIAVLAMMAVAFINLVKTDLSMLSQARRDFEAREVAAGGVMEVLNDINLPTLLPTLSSGSLIAPYNPSGPSPFRRTGSGNDRRYDASVALMRIAPVGESSHGFTRALVYEVSATGVVADGLSTSEVRAEVYRPVVFEPGVVLPRKHYR